MRRHPVAFDADHLARRVPSVDAHRAPTFAITGSAIAEQMRMENDEGALRAIRLRGALHPCCLVAFCSVGVVHRIHRNVGNEVPTFGEGRLGLGCRS